MTKNRISIGLCAVILLVVLRIAIGWHCLYEGILKFDPLHDFSAKGFLGMAKGPTADLYYTMLPDLKGTARLQVTDVTPEKGKKYQTFPVYEEAWGHFKSNFDRRYGARLDDKQEAEVERIYHQYVVSLREYAADNAGEIEQFLGSLARHEENSGSNTTAHQQQRDWDNMMKYRGEAEGWIADLDKMGNAMANAMVSVYNYRLAGSSDQIITTPEKPWVPNPLATTQMSMLNRMVTLGLTAIGICMILGFCNRLASLGCAAFLFNVWLSQFPWPGIHPPLPDVVGHFMIVTKDMVELLACLVLAAMPAGRWGGLDYFLYHYLGGKKLAQWVGLEDVDETPKNEPAATKA